MITNKMHTLFGAIAIGTGLVAMTFFTIQKIQKVNPGVIFMLNTTAVAIILTIASFTDARMKEEFGLLMYIGIVGLSCVLVLFAAALSG